MKNNDLPQVRKIDVTGCKTEHISGNEHWKKAVRIWLSIHMRFATNPYIKLPYAFPRSICLSLTSRLQPVLLIPFVRLLLLSSCLTQMLFPTVLWLSSKHVTQSYGQRKNREWDKNGSPNKVQLLLPCMLKKLLLLANWKLPSGTRIMIQLFLLLRLLLHVHIPRIYKTRVQEKLGAQKQRRSSLDDNVHAPCASLLKLKISFHKVKKSRERLLSQKTNLGPRQVNIFSTSQGTRGRLMGSLYSFS